MAQNNSDTQFARCLNKSCKRFKTIIPLLSENHVLCSECKHDLFTVGEEAVAVGTQMMIDLNADEAYENMTDDERLEMEADRLIAAAHNQASPTTLPPVMVSDRRRYKQPKTKVKQDEDTWTVACSELEGCPIDDKPTPEVIIPQEMFDAWVNLCWHTDLEWLAYLIGHVDEEDEDVYHVTDYYFPKQIATGGHLDVDPSEVPREGVIGAIHSHVAMSAFFSGEDKKHFNHKVEMVLNREGNVKAAIQYKLECGRFARNLESEVTIVESEKQAAVNAALDAALTQQKDFSNYVQSTGDDNKGEDSIVVA